MQSQAVDWRYPQLYNLAVLSVKLLFRNENIIGASIHLCAKTQIAWGGV